MCLDEPHEGQRTAGWSLGCPVPSGLASWPVALPPIPSPAVGVAFGWPCDGHTPEPRTLPPSPFSGSDVPKGAKSFRVSGSSGVHIFIVYDPTRVTVPTDKAHWPLDTHVDLTVSVETASKALDDLKVRGPSPQEGAASPPPCTQGKSPPKHTSLTYHSTHPSPKGFWHLRPHDTS